MRTATVGRRPTIMSWWKKAALQRRTKRTWELLGRGRLTLKNGVTTKQLNSMHTCHAGSSGVNGSTGEKCSNCCNGIQLPGGAEQCTVGPGAGNAKVLKCNDMQATVERNAEWHCANGSVNDTIERLMRPHGWATELLKNLHRCCLYTLFVFSLCLCESSTAAAAICGAATISMFYPCKLRTALCQITYGDVMSVLMVSMALSYRSNNAAPVRSASALKV